MPRRTRTNRAPTPVRRFSPELEAFLAGDNTAFADVKLADDLYAESCFFTQDAEESMTTDEQSRFATLQEAAEQRRLVREVEHYRRLAGAGGFVERWQKLMDASEVASIAFLVARNEHMREFPRSIFGVARGIQ